TGNFLAYGQSGITPDAVALAKGLGGGFPIGAFWISEQYSEVFKPGSHGTTFGGSPLACAAAHAVLDVIEKEDLVKAAREKGLALREGLSRLVERFPSILVEVRGRGLMLALALKDDPADLIASLRERGLLVVGAAGNSIRFLPPLNASDAEIQKALNVTEEALTAFQTKKSE
ncbi:MAG: aminotransferase class III-fold pyridoxal phosphate-dependent enzyme, partial [Opitutae bacterium]